MSIIKHVTLQKIVAHDFRYYPRIINIQLIFLKYCLKNKKRYVSLFQRQKYSKFSNASLSHTYERDTTHCIGNLCFQVLPIQTYRLLTLKVTKLST